MNSTIFEGVFSRDCDTWALDENIRRSQKAGESPQVPHCWSQLFSMYNSFEDERQRQCRPTLSLTDVRDICTKCQVGHSPDAHTRNAYCKSRFTVKDKLASLLASSPCLTVIVKAKSNFVQVGRGRGRSHSRGRDFGRHRPFLGTESRFDSYLGHSRIVSS